MHINVTTTVSIVSDDGQEVARLISKDRTASFDLSEADHNATRRLGRALTVTRERVAKAFDGWLTP